MTERTDLSLHERINDFLNQKCIAVVGVSRRKNHFSRALFRELLKRGYDAIPVNPNVAEVEGLDCCPDVSTLTPPPDAALIMLSGKKASDAVRSCLAAGIPRIWLYGLLGPNKKHDALVTECEQSGVELICGYCPFMFFPNHGLIHRMHGVFMKCLGRYPQ